MGGEFGQWREWNHDASLDWHLLATPPHAGVQRWVRDLNTLYRGEPALHELDCEPGGLRVDRLQRRRAERRSPSCAAAAATTRRCVVACNFTPVPRHNYRVGVPCGGDWQEVLNSDAPLYGGSGQGNLGGVGATPVASHGHAQSIVVTLPPLAIVVFKGRR